MEVSQEELKKAVEGTHGGKATYLEAVPVNESFQGKPVWQGIVHVFELKGHPTASKCYAWSSSVDKSNKKRFYAVLHLNPVKSAADAVKVAIIEEHRRKTGK